MSGRKVLRIACHAAVTPAMPSAMAGVEAVVTAADVAARHHARGSGVWPHFGELRRGVARSKHYVLLLSPRDVPLALLLEGVHVVRLRAEERDPEHVRLRLRSGLRRDSAA